MRPECQNATRPVPRTGTGLGCWRSRPQAIASEPPTGRGVRAVSRHGVGRETAPPECHGRADAGGYSPAFCSGQARSASAHSAVLGPSLWAVGSSAWWQGQMHLAPHFLQDAGRFAPFNPVIDWQ